MYHYIRDVTNTEFPDLKALGVDAFRKQVQNLSSRYELATLESALSFLTEKYTPKKDLCLLTFDDGFIEHYETATPVLKKYGIEGLFFLPTSAIEEGKILPVHKNHFLMAYLGFDEYRKIFLTTMHEKYPSLDERVSETSATATYRWDNKEVAKFKYLINYQLPKKIKDDLLSDIFQNTFGEEEIFAREQYISWQQAHQMQDEGMLIGGHSHSHKVLADCSHEEQSYEIKTCMGIFSKRLKHQDLWPFSYPYGKPETYTKDTMQLLKNTGFVCSFSTVVSSAIGGCNLYEIPRIDTKDA